MGPSCLGWGRVAQQQQVVVVGSARVRLLWNWIPPGSQSVGVLSVNLSALLLLCGYYILTISLAAAHLYQECNLTPLRPCPLDTSFSTHDPINYEKNNINIFILLSPMPWLTCGIYTHGLGITHNIYMNTHIGNRTFFILNLNYTKKYSFNIRLRII